jgi:ribose/xylose/arabinose/galactoside ABC-type transport system permease subunit
VGIDVNAVTFVVYLLAGVCAGIAAILTVGRVGAATPTGGAGVELRVIAAIVMETPVYLGARAVSGARWSGCF